MKVEYKQVTVQHRLGSQGVIEVVCNGFIVSTGGTFTEEFVILHCVNVLTDILPRNLLDPM